ncbi:hypothetical protein GCM10029963_73690 [Micromonospora andamanensis]|uniref:hypothetical protein n=1 Tax=Micromonospora andamanensis TaxID=1287068 RepID=UPI0019512DB6|nr:hypothetical protein [Micromonospora andamanensis]GIJ42690.1 hypothetical protein Vwe01_60150 [Micromonospora andamanensis]
MEHEGEKEAKATDLGTDTDVFEGNQLLRIASTMTDSDIERVRRQVGELGNFKTLATDALSILERLHQSTLGANGQSTDQFFRSCRETRAAFTTVLAREGLHWEQEKYVLDKLTELLHLESAKDTETKKLNQTLSQKMSNRMLLITGTAVAAGAVALTIAAPKAAREIAKALTKE